MLPVVWNSLVAMLASYFAAHSATRTRVIATILTVSYVICCIIVFKSGELHAFSELGPDGPTTIYATYERTAPDLSPAVRNMFLRWLERGAM